MHRACPTECQQYKIARIETAFDRDHANSSLHVGVHHPNHSARSTRDVRPHATSEPLDSFGCPLRIQTHAAAEKILREEPSSHQVRVGYGRTVAPSITCGAGFGTCTLRP